ncbi:MAG: UDP-N-acetylmuramoyl-L-alanine--D-glutamate ligase [Planctomycetota bacterium]
MAPTTFFESAVRPLDSFRGLRVTVMGLGLFGGGKGAVQFFVRRGSRVTVTDLRSEEALRPTIRDLQELPVRWVLGGHREEDFLGADLVIPSPAVPRSAPLLQACREKGVPLDTEMNLLFKYCPARIAAVTGSNGKSTTASLLADMARKRWPGLRAGGNLGRSLLPEVEDIDPEEWVVLEISSFQLEDLASIARRPDVAVVTNASPNHLDRHGTYEAYLAAKRVILEPGPEGAAAVLNAEDPAVRSWPAPGRRRIYFGRTGSVRPGAEGVWVDLERGEAVFGAGGRERRVARPSEAPPEARGETLLFRSSDVPLAGVFNLLNAAAASAAALAMGVGVPEIAEAVREFRPLEHRLERVLESRGVTYYNDSIATTPESTIAALGALGPKVVLICGGSGKGCSYRELGRAISHRARAVVLMGRTAEEIRRSIPERAGGPAIAAAQDLEDAVRKASRLAAHGDAVILSPASASFDMFLNFAERGARFKEIARRLAERGEL